MVSTTPSSSRPTLSVDIGSTTVVSVVSGDAEVDTTTNIVAAVIGIDGDSILTGEPAERLSIDHPDASVQQLIRRFGDPSPVVLGGRAFGVAELASRLVIDAARDAQIVAADTSLVLTHPPAWRDHRVELLSTVGRSAGFEEVSVTSAPLAAIATLDPAPAGSHLLVVDIGGGSVDASVVDMGAADGGEPSIVATQSLERLGGADFDQAVFTHVSTALDGMIGELDLRDPEVRRATTELRSRCTEAKERLSTGADATVTVTVGNLDTTVRITREEFESLIRPQAEAIVTLVDRVIASAATAELHTVLLTGGSASIPLVRELLAGHLGRSVSVADDPASAVARGALAATDAARARAANVSTADTTNELIDEGATAQGERPTTMTSQQSAPVADGEASDSGATADEQATRKTPPPPPERVKTSPSTGAKVGVAAAATAAAVAAGVVFGDDIAAALDTDDAPADGPGDAAAAGAPTPGARTARDDDADDANDKDDPADSAESRRGDSSSDDSLDEFDTVTSTADGTGPRGTPLSFDAGGQAGPAGQDFAGAAGTQRLERERPQQRAESSGPDYDAGGDGGGGSARTAPRRPQPPEAREQADAPTAQRAATEAPAPAATPAPAPGPASATATPTATETAAPAAAPAPAPPEVSAPGADPGFEAARAALLDRLETFEAPPGTSPEDAADLRQDLADAVERFRPAPGQSTEDALDAMRDDFDRRVEDFVQDQKIDALVREAERDNRAEAEREVAAPAPADAAPDVSREAPTDVQPDLDPVDSSAADDTAVPTTTRTAALVDDFDDAAAAFDIAAGGVGPRMIADPVPADLRVAQHPTLDIVGDAIHAEVSAAAGAVGAPVDVPIPARDPDGADDLLIDVRAQLPENFEIPQLISTEAGTPQFTDVEQPPPDDTSGFGVEGLEDEGDAAFLDPADDGVD